MFQGFKDNAVSVDKAREMTAEELAGKFSIGVLTDIDKPNYLEQYAKIRDRAAKKQ
jgi:2-oxoglutarate ferredoxin oxidoreductase subunit beta